MTESKGELSDITGSTNNILGLMAEDVLLVPDMESSRRDEVLTFAQSSHDSTVLNMMYDMYQNHQLTDVTISVPGDSEGRTSVKCHRNVLAATSPYFKVMFTTDLSEKHQDDITIHEVDAGCLGQVIEYAYTGNITINTHNAQNMLSASSLLQIDSIKFACARFMKAQLDDTNCIGINLFAQLHGCNDLAICAREYMEKHFTNVSHGDEFSQMEFTHVSELLASNELNVEKEEIVFDALLRWIHYDLENRREHMCTLIQPIRFGLLSLSYLQKNVMKCPLISSCTKCSHLVTDIKSFELNPATYRGQYKFNMVLRLGMIKPERCFLLLSSNQTSHNAIVNCYNPLTRETYYVSMIQPDQCMMSHDPSIIPDDPLDYEGGVYDVEYPACVVTSDNQIYLAGGNAASNEFSDTYSDDSYHSYNEHTVQKHFFLYDNDHDTWVRKAPMLFPKSNFALVYVSGKIYCFGGVTFYQHPTEIIECYDCMTNRWTYVGMMPVTLVDLCAISYEHDIYILGGRTGVGAHNVLMKYNITDATWTTLAHMPTARFKFGVCVIGNEIYVVGGQIYSHANHTIKRDTLRSVEVYNIALNQWRQGPSLPQSMYNVGLVVLNGSLYACGTTVHQSRSAYRVFSHVVVYRMDLVKRKWKLVESDLCGAQAYVCIAADMYTRKLSQVFRPDVDT